MVWEAINRLITARERYPTYQLHTQLPYAPCMTLDFHDFAVMINRL